jgi:hypothetical protein
MIEMKTRDLIGKPLNWAVAQYADKHVTLEDIHWENYCPSTDWAVGGPIIERAHIAILSVATAQYAVGQWAAEADLRQQPSDLGEGYAHEEDLGYLFYANAVTYGPTPLVAAMRCLVIEKFGETVKIPKELL